MTITRRTKNKLLACVTMWIVIILILIGLKAFEPINGLKALGFTMFLWTILLFVPEKITRR